MFARGFFLIRGTRFLSIFAFAVLPVPGIRCLGIVFGRFLRAFRGLFLCRGLTLLGVLFVIRCYSRGLVLFGSLPVRSIRRFTVILFFSGLLLLRAVFLRSRGFLRSLVPGLFCSSLPVSWF